MPADQSMTADGRSHLRPAGTTPNPLADGGVFATERVAGLVVVGALVYLVVVRQAWRSVLK